MNHKRYPALLKYCERRVKDLKLCAPKHNTSTVNI